MTDFDEIISVIRDTRYFVFVIIAIIALWILRKIVLSLLWKRTENSIVRYRIRKTSAYIVTIISILLIIELFIGNLKSMGTFLGLVSAGLAIALKDFVTNFASWIFIVWRRPFEVGDRIEVGEFSGDVIDIRAFQFTLMEIGNWVEADQSTGRVIQLPNSSVITNAIANYSKGFQFIWNEIPVLITFESDWEKAKKILSDIVIKHTDYLSHQAGKKVKEANKKYLIHYSTLTPIVYTSVKDSGVMLTMRYLCEPRDRRGTQQAIWEEVLRKFSQHDDIQLAYPTYRHIKE